MTAGGRSRAGFRCSDPSPPCPSPAAAELPASRPQRPRPERGGVGSPPPGAVRSVRWTLRAQRRALGLEGWTTGLHWARLLRTGGGRARSCPCSLSSLTADRTPPRKEEPRCGGSKVAHSAQQGCGAGRGGRVPAPRQSPGPALTRLRVCHGADSGTLLRVPLPRVPTPARVRRTVRTPTVTTGCCEKETRRRRAGRGAACRAQSALPDEASGFLARGSAPSFSPERVARSGLK